MSKKCDSIYNRVSVRVRMRATYHAVENGVARVDSQHEAALP